MFHRPGFAYVVEVHGPRVILNIHETHRGTTALTPKGISNVLEFGSLFGVRDGHRIFVLQLQSVKFEEPSEAHRAGVGSSVVDYIPLRRIIAHVIGILEPSTEKPTGKQRNTRNLSYQFKPGSLTTPALGTEAFPLAREEIECILQATDQSGILLGADKKTGVHAYARPNSLLNRHVVVLGATGQGKSCFTAAVLQQLLQQTESMRCVIFDINGEYYDAFSKWNDIEHTIIGYIENDQGKSRKIKYYELGLSGLEALLNPGEGFQRPALRFALRALPYIRWDAKEQCVRLAESDQDEDDYDFLLNGGQPDADPVFFRDPVKYQESQERIKKAFELREQLSSLQELEPAAVWPPMEALIPLIIGYSAITSPDSLNTRNLQYIDGLIRRIEQLLNDPAFKCVIDVNAGDKIDRNADIHPLEFAQKQLIKELFSIGEDGFEQSPWKVHIINFRNVAHDLLPFILTAILQALMNRLFELGQQKGPHLLLVLEEAHHYVRTLREDQESFTYDRLAKEGRKFKVSLWLSTQRPSEVSPTVLSQCGTWVCLRLSDKKDLETVSKAAQWVGGDITSVLTGLRRQEALIFGVAFPITLHLQLCKADPKPRSDDPDFEKQWGWKHHP